MSNAPDFGPEAKALLSILDGCDPTLDDTEALAAIQAFGAAAYRRGQDDEAKACADHCGKFYLDDAQVIEEWILTRIASRKGEQ